MRAEALKGHLDGLILATLQAGPAHGYAIAQTLRARSDGELDLPEGTLYPALHRLERAGLLQSDWTTAEGRRRRVYSLTEDGRRALERQRHEWKAFSGAMQLVLGAER